MIDPLLPNATIKVKLLENILEIINSNDEKFLDISIVCEDGSFLWSQFLLAAASNFFARAMQGIEVTQIVFPDSEVEDVRGILLGLLYNSVPMETAHVNSFVKFLSSPGSSSKKNDLSVKDWSDIKYCLDSGIVKTEIDEVINGEDLDLNWTIPTKPIKNGEIQLEQLEQSAFQSVLKWTPLPHKLLSTEIQNGESTANLTNMEVDDNNWVSGTGHGCSLCEDVFSNYKLLQEHKKLKHDKKSLSKVDQNKKCGPGEIVNCSLCEYTCTNLRSLREHKKRKHPGEFLAIPQTGDGDLKFMCHFCNDFFMTKDDVLNHVKIHHEDCFQTWFSTEKKQADKERQKQSQQYQQQLLKNFYKKDGNGFKCNLCNDTFHTLASFKDHMSTAHKENYTKKLEFICDVCGAGFLRKTALTHHSQVHLPPVTCPQCDKPFATNLSLLKHQKFSCKSEVALKFCEFCGKGFKSNYALKIHVNNVHMNHRSFKCTICGNAFKTLTHFQNHCTGKHNMSKDNCKQYLVMVNPEVEKNKD